MCPRPGASWPSSRTSTTAAAATLRAVPGCCATSGSGWSGSTTSRSPCACAVARYADVVRLQPEGHGGRAPAAGRATCASSTASRRHGELARYHLYRRTYFARCRSCRRGRARPPAAAAVRAAGRAGDAHGRALRAADGARLAAEDRRAFGELVFPRVEPLQDAELQSPPGGARVFVLVRTSSTARVGRFTVREPSGPAEVGRLYRLLSDSGLAPVPASRQLVLLDREERVVGGITWRTAAPRVAHVEGLVIAPALRSQRLAAALVEDFCARLAERGLRRDPHPLRSRAVPVRPRLPCRPSLGRPRPLPRAAAVAGAAPVTRAEGPRR